MKYFSISTAILLLLVILCLVLSSAVIKTVEHTVTLLEGAVDEERSGNRPGALILLRDASDHWNKNQIFFGTVLRHDEIDDVETEFARLQSYATTKDDDDFISNCEALLAQLKHITEMEKLSFENIM